MNMKKNPENLIYLNGQFVQEAEARVSVFDRGFLYGDGVFETMRSYDGRIFRLTEHMQRLQQSAGLIKLRLSHTPEQLAGICNKLLKRNGLSDAILRMSVTRGPVMGGIGVARAGEPCIVAFARPPMSLPADAYVHGVSARVVSVRRTPRSTLDSRIKSMNFLNYILARAEAEEAGAYEAILLNHAGMVTEASTANIFFASDDRLVTPDLACDILPGITRAAVLELAAGLNVPCDEKAIEASSIGGFQECFLTNSGVELLPVTEIDGNTIGSGRPGPLYARLHEAYRAFVRKG